MPRLSDDALAALKEANPLDLLIESRTKLGRTTGRGIRAGQCLCAPERGKAPLWVNCETNTFGCLKPAGCGGDVFAFLAQFEGLDFTAAVARLGGGDVSENEATRSVMAARRSAVKAERLARERVLIERERERAWRIWQRGVPARGSPVDAYFRHRGLDPLGTAALRFSFEEPFYSPPDKPGGRPVLVHSGPCMLAAIQAPDGRFCGLHRTWLAPLDQGRPVTASGKARIMLPDGSPANAKKMRGIKKGGAIRLRDGAPDVGEKAAMRVLLIGEGIETTATALQAIERFGEDGACYSAWVAGDLGNISGGTLGAASRHPTRPDRYVPSAIPDPLAPGLMPPPWAARVILLGDGDSDPETTYARLACGKTRYEAAGFPTAICMAPAGQDFNDMARG